MYRVSGFMWQEFQTAIKYLYNMLIKKLFIDISKFNGQQRCLPLIIVNGISQYIDA